MNALELKSFRERLLRELAEATDSVRRDRNVAEEGEGVSMSPDEADWANLSHDRAVTDSLTEARAHRLRAIEEAMERLDRGEYGLCTRCEQDIHSQRLIAMPWARFCLHCQTELELAGSVRRIQRPDSGESGYAPRSNSTAE